MTTNHAFFLNISYTDKFIDIILSYASNNI